jgi:prepilin signal peptidase PulO-like enzyme (type II secretory pathway)
LGFPYILWALLAGTGAAGVAAIWLMRRGASAKTRIPYAPFLCLGAQVALVAMLLPLR